MRALNLIWVGLGLVVALGCSSGPSIPKSERAKVSGTITLDGKPLTTGKIAFDARNGEPPPILDILDGKYQGEVPVGKVKVSITSTKQTTWKEVTGGKEGPGYDEPTTIDVLPERYKNINREVKAGENRFDFDTQSK